MELVNFMITQLIMEPEKVRLWRN